MFDIVKKILDWLTGTWTTKLRAETVTQTKRFNDTIYGGWLAVNIGNTEAKVYGIPLQPGEGLSSQSIVKMSPRDKWEEPIDIEIIQPGAVRLLRSVNTLKRKG